MNQSARTGVLLVVSGPSGSGKTTLCRGLSVGEGCVYSVSCTTRAPRVGERDGVDYRFLSEEVFSDLVKRGEFLEYANVFGRHYGTLRADVVTALEAGLDVVMDLDVQGAAQVRACHDPLIQSARADVFVTTATECELRERLSGRATETVEQLELRLSIARQEVAHWRSYRYLILSGAKEEDAGRIRQILYAERLRTTLVKQSPDFGQGEIDAR
jgi:guanylate kinase